MPTPFSQANADFSRLAHELAVRDIYPQLFGTTDIQYSYPGGGTDDLSRLFDAEMNVDVVARVKVSGLRERLPVLIQERFRDRTARNRKDVTITEWNERTNKPSELYKMTAGLFVYGATDGLLGWDFDDDGRRRRVIVAEPTRFYWLDVESVADMYLGMIQGKIAWDWQENPRTGQPFITIRRTLLDEYEVTRWTFGERPAVRQGILL